MKKIILSLLFLFPSLLYSADYTISTSTINRERALTFQANQSKQTNQQLLQETIDKWLDDRIRVLKEQRQIKLREGYENLSPTDKAKVDSLIPNVP